jgi:hypothetical protein
MQIDPKDLAHLEYVFGGMPDKIDKVLMRAINASIMAMKGKVARVVRRDLPFMKLRDIRKRVWLERANRKKLHGVLIGGKAGWPLYKFGAIQIGKAPTPGGGVTIPGLGYSIPHAFIAQMKSKHKGVFLRSGIFARMESGRFKGKIREKIKEQRTADITQIIERTAALPEILAFGQETLTKRVGAEMELILSGKRT